MAVSPALRRRRIARTLLHLRESRGLTARQAAAEAKRRAPALSWSESKVTRLETCRVRRPRAVDVAALLDVYDVTDPATRAAYLRYAREAAQTGWWDGYRDVLGDAALHADLETGASRIRVFGLAALPEVVQTDGYARLLVDATLDVDEETAERHVEARMLRKQILARPDAPRLTVVIDESALRKIPEPVRDEQLRYLVQVQRPGVRVHVLPDRVGLHPAVSWSRTPTRSSTTAVSTTPCRGARCPWGKRAPCCSARPASPAWGPREPRLFRGAAVRPPFPAVAALQQDRALGERLRQAPQQVNAGGTVLGRAQHQTAHPEMEHDDVGVGHVDVDLPRPAERFHHGLVEIDGVVVDVGPPSPRCTVVWRFRVVPVPTAQPDELLQTRRPVDESSVGSQFVGGCRAATSGAGER